MCDIRFWADGCCLMGCSQAAHPKGLTGAELCERLSGSSSTCYFLFFFLAGLCFISVYFMEIPSFVCVIWSDHQKQPSPYPTNQKNRSRTKIQTQQIEKKKEKQHIPKKNLLTQEIAKKKTYGKDMALRQ